MPVVSTTHSGDSRQAWRERLRAIGAEWEYAGGDICALYTLSGKVSDYYFNSNVLSQDPALLDELCGDVYVPELKARDIGVDWVLTYPPYGLPFACSLARALKSSFGYIQSLDSPALVFDIPRGSRVLLVADDLFSGSSILKTLKAAQARGCDVAPVLFVFGNFSGRDTFEGMEVFSVIKRDVKLYNAAESPLVARGVKAVNAREHWDEFIRPV